jgi:C4-type Zn-finger protein
MKIVVRPDGSTYESETDFKCPNCKETEDLKVLKVPENSPLYRDGIRFIIDCRSCSFFGSPDGKYMPQRKQK